MDRRTFLGTFAGGLLGAALAVEAQQAEKVWRIGLLDFGVPDSAEVARWKAFRERLRDLGYVEGQNVLFEARWGSGQVSRLPSLAAELINAKVDIIVTAGNELDPNRHRIGDRPCGIGPRGKPGPTRRECHRGDVAKQ